MQQSVRTLCEATQFPEELPSAKFVFDGECLQEKLQSDIRACKDAYEKDFKHPIPVIDNSGKLVLVDPKADLKTKMATALKSQVAKASKD